MSTRTSGTGQPPTAERAPLAPVAPVAPVELAERWFRGDGVAHPEGLGNAYTRPERYVAPPSLVDAVNTALYLRRPLLLEGDPGSGKTRLAFAVAYELGYPLLEIYVRSTAQAQDLLYTYDAIRRLYDIQEQIAAAEGGGGGTALAEKGAYVDLGPLGQAIDLAAHGIPSVVLIDEVDKADIDFPNDLLLVLDQLKFSVDEVPGMRYTALGEQTREERRAVLPLVIVTSNREKELPAPFLRRCLFAYIPFPSAPELDDIVRRHYPDAKDSMRAVALARFGELRHQQDFTWRKPPSTSELLDWFALLERDQRAGRLRVDDLRTRPLADLPHLHALVKVQADSVALRAIATTAPGVPADGADEPTAAMSGATAGS